MTVDLPDRESIAEKCAFGTDRPSPGLRSIRENVEAFLALPTRCFRRGRPNREAGGLRHAHTETPSDDERRDTGARADQQHAQPPEQRVASREEAERHADEEERPC